MDIKRESHKSHLKEQARRGPAVDGKRRKRRRGYRKSEGEGISFILFVHLSIFLRFDVNTGNSACKCPLIQ